jgi:dipeptidase E
MLSRKVLLISNSTLYGTNYLEHCSKQIHNFLQDYSKNEKKTVVFFPYALKDHDTYAQKASEAFNKFGYKIESIHKVAAKDQVNFVNEAEAFFIGGGNTFRYLLCFCRSCLFKVQSFPSVKKFSDTSRLLKSLYDLNLLPVIRNRVLTQGVPYIGILC